MRCQSAITRSLTLCFTVASPWYALVRLSVFVRRHHILRESVYCMITVVVFWLSSFLLLRVYLLYYDHQHSRFVATNKWKLLMNPRSLSRQKSYWMVNRYRKYGDERWIIKNVLVPITSTFSVLFLALRWALAYHLGILQSYRNHQFYYIDRSALFIWSFVHVVIGAFIWRKYPAFADRWLIRREISILLLLCLGVPSSIVVCIVLQYLFAVSLTQVNAAVCTLVLNAVMCVMVKYPQTANIRKARELRDRMQTEERIKLTWQQLVSSKHGFESFMNFLQSEFSTENLLFVTEYTQVKNVLMQNGMTRDKMENALELPSILNLPETLPVGFTYTFANIH